MSAPADMSGLPDLLTLWEAAAGADPADRDDALLRACDGGADRSLGARNAALFDLRARLFGNAQRLRCNCPECAAVAEFCIDCETLSRTALPSPEAFEPQQMVAEGHRIDFRLPDLADLRAARIDGGPPEEALLRRCVARSERIGSGPCPLDELPAEVLTALSERMEELEPGAAVRFELTCPECRSVWTAAMNVGAVLWSELEAHAERLLLDIDMLARAYGWSEGNVLALSPTRRAAYVQLIGAAE